MNTDNLKLYEVHVSKVREKTPPELVGVWTGPADSEMKAKELAEVDIWQQRWTDAEFSPAHTLRELPRYLSANKWFHSFSGASEGIIRWVYDKAQCEVVSAASLNSESGLWTEASKRQIKQLMDTLGDGLDIDGPDEIPGVKTSETLPAWAVNASPPRRAKP